MMDNEALERNGLKIQFIEPKVIGYPEAFSFEGHFNKIEHDQAQLQYEDLFWFYFHVEQVTLQTWFQT